MLRDEHDDHNVNSAHADDNHDESSIDNVKSAHSNHGKEAHPGDDDHQ